MTNAEPPSARARTGAMRGLDSSVSTAENYRRFSEEAAPRSPAYETLATAVADDRLILSFLGRLAPPKRQPNLLFASARYLLGVAPEADSLRRLVEERADELASVMNTRSTQTNEPARCSLLLPALALIPSPLALLEVGAAAGLTLVPDLYSYDFGGRLVSGGDPDAPLLPCRTEGPVPVPTDVPEVAWRRGIDLNPLDVGDPDDLEWLRCLIWPGEEERLERLDHAAGVVARSRPVIVQGDLVEDLREVAEAAPEGASLVVYHTAVLAYVEENARRRFEQEVRQLGAVWLSNEAPGVVASGSDARDGAFVLIRDGEHVLARTDPHGTWLSWLE